MGIIYISLTEKCNKKCIYCSCHLVEEKEITYSDSQITELKKIFNLLQKIDSIIFLGGGEPGIINPIEIDKIFSSLSKCWIATNGEFVKTYYELYNDKIEKIIYHVLYETSTIYETPVNEYVYIIHKNNIETIPRLLNKFQNKIQLKLYNSINIENDLLLLDKKDIHQILKYCYDVDYDPVFIEQLKNYLNINHKIRSNILNVCKYDILPTPSLILSKNKIAPCCRGDHLTKESYPDITYENFINYVYANKPVNCYGKEILDEIPCKGCNRLINNENIFDNLSVKNHIKNKIKVNRIIKNASI